MGQTLTNGIFLPNEGERNCYTGLAVNWRALDYLIGGYNVHIANAVIHVSQADRDKWDAVDNKADASALTAHTGNTTIHVTAADKAKWDAVTSKADDADVLHKEGAENIPGLKNFTNTIKSQKEIEFAGNRLAYILPEFSASYSGLSLCTYGANGAVKIGAWKVDDNDVTKHVLDTSLGYLNVTTGAVNSVNCTYLTPRNSTDSKLGDSTNKWRTINGLNPGALFLPQDRSARVDISAYFTNTANGATNRVTPPEDGYIFLSVTDVVIVHCFSQNASNLTHFGQTFSRPATGQVYCLFPVRKSDNVAVQWYTTAAAVSLSAAYFIPCKGNV